METNMDTVVVILRVVPGQQDPDTAAGARRQAGIARDVYEIRYSATREFDEMVLRGRFTNARRAHSKKAGAWPNVDTADLRWKNIHKTLRPRSWTRAADVKSADVPEVWQAGYKKVVAVHCLRDVLETAMRDVDVKMSHRLKTELLARIR